MRRKNIITGVLLVLFAVISLQTKAQHGYTAFDNEDNMRIMYNWQRSSLFNANSDAVLSLRITNNNEYSVKWTYSVGFYRDDILVFESEPYELCLNAGQSRRGGLAGLRFSVEGLTLADTEKDNFSWEFGIFEVEQVDGCE